MEHYFSEYATVSDVLNYKASSNPDHQGVLITPPNASILQLIAYLADHHIGVALIGNDVRSPLGIVSERDVIRFIASNGKDALDVTSVKNLMSKDVITCRQNDRLRDVALDMGANTVRHILVIDDNRNPVGIVSSVDVVIFAGVG